MKNSIWKYGFIFMLLCLSKHATAQSAIELQTAQLFENQITWIKHFSGRIDGVHAASLSLGFDGIHSKGFLTYTLSGEQYLLEGTLQNGDLVLLEKYNNQPSGYIDGSFDSQNIALNWKSIDGAANFQAVFWDTQKVTEVDTMQLAVYAGVLDDQSVKLTLQKTGQTGVGNIIFANKEIEKLYATYISDRNVKVENLSSGYSFTLVNTKENQFESSFILPASSTASHLGLRHISTIDMKVEEYLSQYIDFEILLPSLDSTFDKAIQIFVQDWKLDMEKQKEKVGQSRFSNAARIWFEIESIHQDYLSGVVYYNSTWNKQVQSKTFTYNRPNSEMLSLAQFLKGSVKWEKAVKERMIAAKELNTSIEKDQYKKWIDRADIMEPILCEGGLQFLTESNTVFGQGSTFMSWDSLSPLVISSAKLSKLRKSK